MAATQRKKILTETEYTKICNFIENYNGLAIDCETDMVCEYAKVDPFTLNCILQTEWCNRMRSQYWRYESKGEQFLRDFIDKSDSSFDPTILLNKAKKERVCPVALCRIILHTKYPEATKPELAHLIKFPYLIEEDKLASNVMYSFCTDTQDGPLIDLRRRALGEEYEYKLKSLAKTVGIHFSDENELRRLGYDKTPDIKMIIPFLFKGEVINWIESKAAFGDVKSHKWNIHQQLNSYCNRFGPGIIIYWFGYHENTPLLSENGDLIIVLDDFPCIEDLEFLKLEPNESITNKLCESCS